MEQDGPKVDRSVSMPSQHDPPNLENLADIRITHRTDQSHSARLLQACLRPFSPQIARPSSVSPPGSPRLRIPWAIRQRVTVVERKIEDIWVYDLVAKAQFASEKAAGSLITEPLTQPVDRSPSGAPRKLVRNRVVYLSGGCWQIIPSQRHWRVCATLALSLPNTTVSLVSYPLAPENPAPTTIPQLCRLYPKFFELQEPGQPPERVTLMGDSAGGNIVLAITLEALGRDPENAPAPDSIMVICPSVDLTRGNPELWKAQDRDPLLTAKFVVETAVKWAGTWPRDDPRLSPLFGDISLFAKRGVRVNGMVGGVDLLGVDTRLFRDKCVEAGVKGDWLDWDGMMHCWILMPGWLVSESREALKWLGNVLRAEMDRTAEIEESVIKEFGILEARGVTGGHTR